VFNNESKTDSNAPTALPVEIAPTTPTTASTQVSSPSAQNVASPSTDPVQRPDHYRQGGIECIDAIRAALGAEGFKDYCTGNVLKYSWRWRFKNGVQDLEKAKVYLDWLIEAASA